MKCPNCYNKFSFLQRIKSSIQHSGRIKCSKCKKIYKKTSSIFNSLCIGLSFFTSICIIEIFLNINDISTFLLMVVFVCILSIMLYPLFVLICDNFTSYEVIDDHDATIKNNMLYPK
ncbi:MAG: hypothetical protein Q4B63_01400 [Clostridium perfringens]|nr:hypothetical protein [Clostridium perfringens]